MSTRMDYRDIAGLQALVSPSFGEFGRTQCISQAMIDSFAELTFDQQWIHVDTERARAESPFGDTIAHGFLVLSLATSLRPGLGVDIVGYNTALNYGIDELRFLAPVVANATVHGRVRLHGVEARRSGTLLTQEMALHVVGQDKPAILFKWKLLYTP